MMERWKSLSRGRKIALECAVMLLLLLVLWLVWVPSAELAFRRAVAGVGYDGRDPDLLMDLEYDKVESGQLNTQKRRIGLLTDGELVLRVELCWCLRRMASSIPRCPKASIPIVVTVSGSSFTRLPEAWTEKRAPAICGSLPLQ